MWTSTPFAAYWRGVRRGGAPPWTASARCWALFAALVSACLGAACGDDDPGGGSGGGSGGPEPGPVPDPQGPSCGEDELGWRTSCEVLVARMTFTDSDGVEFHTESFGPGDLAGLFGATFAACCEGCPTPAEADGACFGRAARAVCDQAKAFHDSSYNTGFDPCPDGNVCAFDMQACLDSVGNPGTPHVQTHLGDDDDDDEYTLAVDIDAGVSEEFDAQTGCLEGVPDDDSLLPCGRPPGAVLDVSVSGFERADGDGSSRASIAWNYGSESGLESASSMSVNADYTVYPCPEHVAECLSITGLEVAVPDFSYNNFAVSDASLTVVSAAPARIAANDTFSLSATSVQAVLHFGLLGQDFYLDGTNLASSSGRVSPATDHVEIDDLQFQWVDTSFDATLELDLSMLHENRSPNVDIQITSEPVSCSQQVVFEALTTDPDLDSVGHLWTGSHGMLIAGPTLPLVLPDGDHLIILSGTDEHGARDRRVLRYRRQCT